MGLLQQSDAGGDAYRSVVHRFGKGNGVLHPRPPRVDGLSARELQVLRRLAMGQTNREIGEAYNISTKTVDTYRLRLLKKLGLRNNADLSRFAIKHGLVQV